MVSQFLYKLERLQLIKKRKGSTHKKKKSIAKHIEKKERDIDRDREQQAEEEHTALGWDFISLFLLQISLSSSSSSNLNFCLVKQIGLGFMRSS